MNKFTKKDLQDIMEACMYWFECPDDGIMESAIPLVRKIQSMIDNYCEHDFDMTGWINDSSGCRWYECKKCERWYR